MRGIGHERIAARRRGRRIEGEPAARLKIEMLVRDAARRPVIEGAPLVRARIEHGRLGELAVSLPFQAVCEAARSQRPVVVAGGSTEARVAERDPGVPEPLTVVPWSHDEEVEATTVGLLERPIARERPVLVFLIP